ncbi:MAG: AraC family transcriptional regulator [Candidatus Hydrogenedentes bacterium]|nr:AraC family transcriptional regulator [Candidatus Hydrogenedentota bacterium]
MTLGAPRFEVGRELLIAGYNERYTFESRKNIPQQWDRCSLHIGRIPGQIGAVSYGVCWNYDPGRGFDYLSGVEVASTEELPGDFRHVVLPAQRYAVFTHEGHVSTIPDTIQAIWRDWLPNSGHEVSAAPSFERYTEEFDGETGEGGIEIWIPIRQ